MGHVRLGKVLPDRLHILFLGAVTGAELELSALGVGELRAVAHCVHANGDAVQNVAAAIFCGEYIFTCDAVHERDDDRVGANGRPGLFDDFCQGRSFDSYDHEV